MPEIMYRRILNESFGPGGWGLMPRGEPQHYQVKPVYETCLSSVSTYRTTVKELN